jgi:hypothetical protein
MRIVCRIAIALWLISPAAAFPAAKQAPPQQDAPATANSSVQVPAAPKENAPEQKSPPENVPAEQTPQAPAAEPSPAAPENPQAPSEEQKALPPPAKKTTTGSASPVRKRRKRPARPPETPPQKVVVREGGAREPAAQIAPGLTPEEATRERRNAERWLGSTDDQLKQLADRPLDAQKRETVGQIRNYMDGARSALKEGDVRRASTLAQKAHLLSEDLLKH